MIHLIYFKMCLPCFKFSSENIRDHITLQCSNFIPFVSLLPFCSLCYQCLPCKRCFHFENISDFWANKYISNLCAHKYVSSFSAKFDCKQTCFKFKLLQRYSVKLESPLSLYFDTQKTTKNFDWDKFVIIKWFQKQSSHHGSRL